MLGYAGGIVGRIQTAADGAATFTNCTNNDEVTSNAQNAGGIVGYAAVKGVLTFNNCDNYGAVTTNTKKQVGGIIGYIDSVYSSLKFTDCDNGGAITANGEHNNASAGGIAGAIGGVGGEFTNCVNKATGVVNAEGNLLIFRQNDGASANACPADI